MFFNNGNHLKYLLSCVSCEYIDPQHNNRFLYKANNSILTINICNHFYKTNTMVGAYAFRYQHFTRSNISNHNISQILHYFPLNCDEFPATRQEILPTSLAAYRILGKKYE